MVNYKSLVITQWRAQPFTRGMKPLRGGVILFHVGVSVCFLNRYTEYPNYIGSLALELKNNAIFV